jgi:predicted AAA+ superfamily ATPase
MLKTDSILTKKIFKRDLAGKISGWIKDRELILLLGSRQTGKTNLLYYIIQNLVRDQKVKLEDISYLDAETLDDAELIAAGPEKIVEFLKARTGERKYLFIDEIHYVRDIGRILKQLVDHYSDTVKIFATGSSALEIKKNFRESMTGRKIIFEVLPLTFREFLVFKEQGELLKTFDTLAGLKSNGEPTPAGKRRFLDLYNEYCVYGGYPRVVLEPETEKKKAIIDEIYSSYVRRDVMSFFEIESPDKFNNLLKYIALNSGQILNIETAVKDIGGIARKTVEKYMGIMESTYIVKRITPFFKRKTREIVKMGKVYFRDSGIRNRIINNFHMPRDRADGGFVYETAVFMNLHKYTNSSESIKFWRSKGGNEVDFIIDKEKTSCIEVKMSSSNFKPQAFDAFMDEYKPAEFIILNETENHKKNSFIFKSIYLL